MSRLSSLVVRGAGVSAVAQTERLFAEPGVLDDLRLFAVSWLGGLVFFGTFFS